MSPAPTSIDYRMAKRAVIRQIECGNVPIEAVSDAHPELLRAAQGVGTVTNRTCPICRMADDRAVVPLDESNTLREVTYLHGKELRQRSGCVVADDDELDTYVKKYPSFVRYIVECCLVCGWNHLVTSTVMGHRHLPGVDMRNRT